MNIEKKTQIIKEACKGTISRINFTNPVGLLPSNISGTVAFSHSGQPAVGRFCFSNKKHETTVKGKNWDLSSEHKVTAYMIDHYTGFEMYQFGDKMDKIIRDSILEPYSSWDNQDRKSALWAYKFDGTTADGKDRYKKVHYHSMDDVLLDWDIPLLTASFEEKQEILAQMVQDDDGRGKHYRVKCTRKFVDDNYSALVSDKHGTKITEDRPLTVTVPMRNIKIYDSVINDDVVCTFIECKQVIKAKESNKRWSYDYFNIAEDRPLVKKLFMQFKQTFHQECCIEQERLFKLAYDRRVEILKTGAIQELVSYFNECILEHRGLGFDLSLENSLTKDNKFTCEYTKKATSKYEEDKDISIVRQLGDRFTTENCISDLKFSEGAGCITSANGYYYSSMSNESYAEGYNPKTITADDIANAWVNQESTSTKFKVGLRIDTEECRGGYHNKGIHVEVGTCLSSIGWCDSATDKAISKKGYGFFYKGTSTKTSRSYDEQGRLASNIKTVKKHINESIERAFNSYNYSVERVISKLDAEKARLSEETKRQIKYNQEGSHLQSLLDKSNCGIVVEKDGDNYSVNSNQVVLYISPDFDGFQEATDYITEEDGFYRVKVSLTYSEDDGYLLNNKLDITAEDTEVNEYGYPIHTMVVCDAESLAFAIKKCIEARNKVKKAFKASKDLNNQNCELNPIKKPATDKVIVDEAPECDACEDSKEDLYGDDCYACATQRHGCEHDDYNEKPIKSGGMSDYALEQEQDVDACYDCGGDGNKPQPEGYTLQCGTCKGDGYAC